MKKLMEQIIKFGFVGFLCFFIDYGVMVFLTEVFRIDYLVSSGISFTVSVIVNYILSITFVFETDKDKNKLKEFVVFVFLSVIGLGINEACMWLAVEAAGIYYMISKIGATAVVMVYNDVLFRNIYSFPLPKEKISFGAGIGKEYPFRKFACPCLWLARQILCIDATNDTSSPGCAKSLHGIYTNMTTLNHAHLRNYFACSE